MIGVNLSIINFYASRNSEIMMKKTCSAQVLKLDNQFRLVEQSVQNIYDISETIRPSVEQLSTTENTNAFIESFQKIAITIADNTDGAIAVYYRINPDLNVSGTQGFFWVKSMETGCFEENESTDLLAYDPTDVEHVGWYYIPVWAGKAVWMEPYYNANIDITMISYVVPVYEGTNLIGVVGMDVDFNRMLQIAEDVDIYNSCGAVLVSMNEQQVYYNDCDLLGDHLPKELYYTLQNADSSKKLFSYNAGGTYYKMEYETLENRMKLILYARSMEIDREGYMSIGITGLVFLIAFILTLHVAMHVSGRIVGPISAITETAKHYAQGNWDISVSCDTDDELEILTDNITIMAQKTKEYISCIHDMAEKDGLTGLKNKTAYLHYIEQLKTIQPDTDPGYAVVVFDVNNLKYINDHYGHEKGDELILNAGQYICQTFKHSPVFRIGGDEFVSVLRTEDYTDRDILVEHFHYHMEQPKNPDDAADVSIACGMAVYGVDGADYDAVFACADQRMYENKICLKGGVMPR